MNIVKKYKIWFAISLAVILVGAGMAAINGVNLGIDFTGGTMIQIDLHKTVPVTEVKALISDFSLNPDIVHGGADKTEVIIKTRESLDNAQRKAVIDVFTKEYNLDGNDVLAATQIGPSIGREIQDRALIAIAIASVFILAYITLRFEFVYGVSAIIALIHDILILLSVYAIFQIPITSSFIAAVLTIVGYSINDTIVVFDRVRENVKLMKKDSFFDIADRSLTQTISRSINTSLTTLLVIGSLYVFGTDAIKDFTFPLLAGVLVGTYSSIFIASPVWAVWKTHVKNKSKKYKNA